MRKLVALAAFGVVVVAVTLAVPTAGRAQIPDDTGHVEFRDRWIVRWIERRRGNVPGEGPAEWYPGYFRRGGGAYYDPRVEPTYVYPMTAYYPQDPTDVNAVTIRMRVPGGARVWFDGEATSQTGGDRLFISPALTPGREYVYHVRVQWDDNNRPVERRHDVTVHAGDRIHLNFDR